MTKDEIKALAPVERVAGYIALDAQLATIGARLRKNNRSDNDWTDAEVAEWNAVCDQMDVWWYALSKNELKQIEPACDIVSSICRGEWPLMLEVRKPKDTRITTYFSAFGDWMIGMVMMYAVYLIVCMSIIIPTLTHGNTTCETICLAYCGFVVACLSCASFFAFKSAIRKIKQ